MAEVPPDPDFSVHPDKLMRVVCGIRQKDPGGCLNPDVNHAAAVLAWVANIEMLHPGALPEVLDELIPLVIEQMNRESALSALYDAASEGGLGPEFEAILDADEHGDRDASMMHRCEILQEANGWKQAEAIRWMTKVSGETFGGIKQAVKRGKAAKKAKPGK